MQTPVTAVAQAIAQELIELVHEAIDRTSSGRDAHTDNRLKAAIETRVQTDGSSPTVHLLYDDYLAYIDAGRKPQSGKQPPIEALREWAMARNIPADNSTLFLISRAIHREGIEPRPILSILDQEIEKRLQGDWQERILDAVMQRLNEVMEH